MKNLKTKGIVIILTLLMLTSVLAVPVSADTSETYSLEWSVNNVGSNTLGAGIDPNSNDVIVMSGEGGETTDNIERLDSSDGSQIWSIGADVQDGVDNQGLATNNNGFAYINDSFYIVYRDYANGDIIDTIQLQTASGNIDEVKASDNYFVTKVSGASELYEISAGSLSFVNNNYDVLGTSPRTLDVDNNGDIYIGGNSDNYGKDDGETTDDIWAISHALGNTHASTINGSGQGTALFVGNGGTIHEFTVDQNDNNPSAGWDHDIGSSGVTALSYNIDTDVVLVGDSVGSGYVLNRSDGSQHQTITFADSSRIAGMDAVNQNWVLAQNDGSVRYYSLPVFNDVISIDLQINDDKLVPTETSNYDVIGTHEDSTTSDVSSSASESSDNPSIVSVTESSTTLTYQSDGTTTIRANYTNRTGVILWSNKTVQTDTPQVNLIVDTNPIDLGNTGNYTINVSVFGNTHNTSLQDTLVSEDTSIITVDQTSLEYTAQDGGTVILNATNTTEGETYFDTIEVTVNVPIEWSAWDSLSGGERMILIFGDWSVIYMLASLIISGAIGTKLRSGRFGVVSFGGLIAIGWILDFVPDYVALSLMLFFIFLGFFFEFYMSNNSTN